MPAHTPRHASDDSASHGDLVDWDLAVATAKRLMRPSPDVSRAEARQTVDELRRYAAEAEQHVRTYTGLHAESATAPVLVIDRAGWVQANADGFKEVLRPLMAKIHASRGRPGPLTTAVGSRVTGVEAGSLLGYLSSKVLGQFDPFFSGSPGVAGTAHGGRLLLVAPNIVHVERELEVDPSDFRMWVCLHEETHRVQFTAVPWLRDHILAEMGALLESTELDPQRLAGMVREGVQRMGDLVKGGETSLLDVVQTPEQKAVVERLTAVMSLLEGHADVVMDEVGPDVVPTVATIRRKFTARRAGAGPLDQMIRRLLGFDAKLRQYRDGAIFVRGVTEKVGIDGFNAVWSGPENLPLKHEVTQPDAWVARVHG